MLLKTKNTYDVMGIEAPQLPESLPQVLSWATKNAPEHMKPAILKSTFFVLYALICGVTLKTTAPLRSIRQFGCLQKKVATKLKRNGQKSLLYL